MRDRPYDRVRSLQPADKLVGAPAPLAVYPDHGAVVFRGHQRLLEVHTGEFRRWRRRSRRRGPGRASRIGAPIMRFSGQEPLRRFSVETAVVSGREEEVVGGAAHGFEVGFDVAFADKDEDGTDVGDEGGPENRGC